MYNSRTRDEKENDVVDELSSKVGLLSLNAAGAEPYYLGSSSTFAFSRLINSSLRQVVNQSATATELSWPGIDAAPPIEPCLLPDYDEAIRLSNAYFENIHVHYPFLHEPTFRLWENMFSGGSMNFDPVALFFLNMVSLVYSSRLQPEPDWPDRCTPLAL